MLTVSVRTDFAVRLIGVPTLISFVSLFMLVLHKHYKSNNFLQRGIHTFMYGLIELLVAPNACVLGLRFAPIGFGVYGF